MIGRERELTLAAVAAVATSCGKATSHPPVNRPHEERVLT
jgi:hypothetical protein